MINSVSANVNNDNKATSVKDKAVSVGAGLTGAGIGLAMPYMEVKDTFKAKSPTEINETKRYIQNLMPEVDTFENTANNIKSILEETGLKAKGVKFNTIDKTPEGRNTLKEILDRNIISENPAMKNLKKAYAQMFEEGANAAYFPRTKDFVINKKSLYSSAYHELGHAKNANGNFAIKALQQARCITPYGISAVAPIALAVGLLHKVDKNKPQEQKDEVEKTLDFVSNNAGKLTLASYAPILAEEGLASFNGLKMAKKYLQPEQLGKLKLNYVKAWGTYGAEAALVAGGVALGIKVANVIKEKFTSKQTA